MTDAATSPNIAMYVVFTYCATEVPVFICQGTG